MYFEKEAALPVVPSVTVADFDEDVLAAKHGQKRKHDEAAMDGTATPSVSTSSAPEPSIVTEVTAENAKKHPPLQPASSAKGDFSPELLPLKVIFKD